MKPERQTDPDEVLHRALREWEIKEPLPPRFGESVWQRIAKEETRAPDLRTLFSNWIAQTMARPALAVSYVTVLLIAGLLAGYWHAQTINTRTMESLSASYVQMMDPYQGHGMNR